jgi:hypothetical protein
MGHELANVVLELVVESVGAPAASSSRPAIPISIGRSAVRIASASGLPVVLAMLLGTVFLWRAFASHLELLFYH